MEASLDGVVSFPHWLSAPALAGFGLVEFAIGAFALHRSGALGSEPF